MTIIGQDNGLNKLKGFANQGYVLNKNPLLPFSPVTKVEFSIPDTCNVELFFTDQCGRDTVLSKKFYNLLPGQYSYDWRDDEFNFNKFSQVIFIARAVSDYSNDYFISKYFPKDIIKQDFTTNKEENSFRSISLDNTYIIATELKLKPFSPVEIFLINQDSSEINLLYSDSCTIFNKVIITTEEYEFEISKKYPNIKIILQPEIDPGLYYFVYKTKGEKYSYKFFL